MKSRIPANRRVSFWTGFFVLCASIGAGSIAAVKYALPNIPWGSVASLVPSESPVFTKGDWYIAVFYKGSPDGRPIETWQVSVTGRHEFSGTIQDVSTTSNKAVASGYLRADTLALSYASADPRRPGYGIFFLHAVPPVSDKGDAIWVGTAVGHDCLVAQAGGNPTICNSSTLIACPAILSSQRILSQDYQNTYFIKPCEIVNKIDISNGNQAAR